MGLLRIIANLQERTQLKNEQLDAVGTVVWTWKRMTSREVGQQSRDHNCRKRTWKRARQRARQSQHYLDKWWQDGITLTSWGFVSWVFVQEWQISSKWTRAWWFSWLKMVGDDACVGGEYVNTFKKRCEWQWRWWEKVNNTLFALKKWSVVLCKKVRFCMQWCSVYAR